MDLAPYRCKDGDHAGSLDGDHRVFILSIFGSGLGRSTFGGCTKPAKAH
jgi:hypothetical protein